MVADSLTGKGRAAWGADDPARARLFHSEALELYRSTGDTPADQRRAFARTPTDVLVTTPESLFLLLTSATRESLRGVHTVIVDEVHAVAATKRGTHLALSLERLDALLEKPAQRIGLSATVRPVEEVSAFLAGGQPVQVVQPASVKTIEVSVQVPVPDMSALGELTEGELTEGELTEGELTEGELTEGKPDEEAGGSEHRASIWPAVERRVIRVRRHWAVLGRCCARCWGRPSGSLPQLWWCLDSPVA